MPRTVKLSQAFYEKLGHDLVEELVNWFNETDTTYRGELRELNDLNFARFDAKLEQRLAEVKADVRQELAQAKAELRHEIVQLRESIVALGGEFRAQLEGQGKVLIKWMFGFWATAVPMIGALIVAVLHFLPVTHP